MPVILVLDTTGSFHALLSHSGTSKLSVVLHSAADRDHPVMTTEEFWKLLMVGYIDRVSLRWWIRDGIWWMSRCHLLDLNNSSRVVMCSGNICGRKAAM